MRMVTPTPTIPRALIPNLNTGLKKSFTFQAVVKRAGSLSTTGCRSRALRNGDYAAADGRRMESS